MFNRACRPCARARVRCDGQSPCERCVSGEIECQKVKKKKFTGQAESVHSPRSDHSVDDTQQSDENRSCVIGLCDPACTDTGIASVTSSSLREMDLSTAVEPSPGFFQSTSWPSANDELAFWSQPTMAGSLAVHHLYAIPLVANDSAFSTRLMAQFPTAQTYIPETYWLFQTEEVSDDTSGGLLYPSYMPASTSKFQPIYA